jgi:hypothetical protein
MPQAVKNREQSTAKQIVRSEAKERTKNKDRFAKRAKQGVGLRFILRWI